MRVQQDCGGSGEKDEQDGFRQGNGHDTSLRGAGDIRLCFLQPVSVRSGQAVQDEERRVLEQVQGGVPEGKEQRGDEEKNEKKINSLLA